MTPEPAIFSDAAELGEALAQRIFDEVRRAGAGGFVLGCPTGRSPLPAYQAFARLAARHQPDLSRTHLVMMDEYLEGAEGRWRLCDPGRHYSCAGFAEREIRSAWNRALPAERRLPASQVHIADPDNPQAFERRIESLGGVDLFLLASGASDGHVAFNPPGTAQTAVTHIVRLGEATRRDNMATWPAFTNLAEVPTHGVTVGPATIRRWSRAAVMILAGASKVDAYRRIRRADAYDPSWPATIIHACQGAEIYADQTATTAKEGQPCKPSL